jgi:hypothetical protein
MDPPLTVALHTQRAWRPPERSSGFVALAGWHDRNTSGLRTQWDCCFRAPWSLQAVFKYDWMLQHVQPSLVRPHRPWVGLLADTDILFQCRPEEVRAKFDAFGTQLVVGGERGWYPLPRAAPDPFGPNASLSWKQRYAIRHQQQLYPNSGLVMATAAGFERLSHALREHSPNYPCCSFEGSKGFSLDPCNSCRPRRIFPKTVSCTVEDQACLQVALAGSSRAWKERLGQGARGRTPPLSHSVDSDSRLFLNLDKLNLVDLELRGSPPRLAFRKSEHVPCVLHANGYKGILHRVAPLIKESLTWWVQPKMAPDEVRASVREEWLRDTPSLHRVLNMPRTDLVKRGGRRP